MSDPSGKTHEYFLTTSLIWALYFRGKMSRVEREATLKLAYATYFPGESNDHYRQTQA